MSDDDNVRPFNSLSEDEQVKEMSKSHPDYPFKTVNLGGQHSIVNLVPTKSDADLALEFKDRIIEAYQPLLKILSELDKAGFNASVNVAKNGLGKIDIVGMQISRVFSIF